eukprot:GAFH01000011.1.p1 GENE.GAFH01000011.1~~GAFH01000011.1.p1  ORF type:complete len:115 (-),score=34.90 GAFH01000011.1:423-767(-)
MPAVAAQLAEAGPETRVTVDVTVQNGDMTGATLSQAFGYSMALGLEGPKLSATATALISVGSVVVALLLCVLLVVALPVLKHACSSGSSGSSGSSSSSSVNKSPRAAPQATSSV